MVNKKRKSAGVWGILPVLLSSACGIALLLRTSNAEAYADIVYIDTIHIHEDIYSCSILAKVSEIATFRERQESSAMQTLYLLL